MLYIEWKNWIISVTARRKSAMSERGRSLISDHEYSANISSDWLISGHQSINSSRDTISILFGKHKRFAFVHPPRQFFYYC